MGAFGGFFVCFLGYLLHIVERFSMKDQGTKRHTYLKSRPECHLQHSFAPFQLGTIPNIVHLVPNRRRRCVSVGVKRIPRGCSMGRCQFEVFFDPINYRPTPSVNTEMVHSPFKIGDVRVDVWTCEAECCDALGPPPNQHPEGRFDLLRHR